ncbi:MAG: C10 family peptidase, partial [Bacteroidales bacterium]|nr:C10 family peptidase [Bacteroidales bacterium]
MKKVFFFVLTFALALCGTLSSQADPVDATTARKVATNFLSQKSGHAVDLVDVTSQMPYSHMYFFVEPNGNGNVILSADDRAIPIIGYSTNTTFDPADLPAHVDSWFRHYDEELAYIIDNDIKATPEIIEEWERLINNRPEPAERAREKSVSPLLTTQWGQGGPSGTLYNNLCPHSGSTYTYAGCTAVATAQIMKYWNHPTQGRGSHSYTHSTYGTLSANFGTTTYAWNSMPNSLSSSSNSTQKTAIATLLYHVGVGCEMNYGTSGSGASTVSYGLNYASAENALKNY